ncbi:hypothetical protein DPMN_024140 [Dreissena polymorpha]|uniref:Uncharacterized protein n=1 Tax=Dreissena polymorpha TaxID=45954 RepID=A0A9D4LP76_DREPO|nr:hypothetical protein DPMN_024140 [Dreissena polymorpha]
MRKRKEMKAAGHRLVDDVTALNSALMNRLSLHPAIETTWFFERFDPCLRSPRIKSAAGQQIRFHVN